MRSSLAGIARNIQLNGSLANNAQRLSSGDCAHGDDDCEAHWQIHRHRATHARARICDTHVRRETIDVERSTGSASSP